MFTDPETASYAPFVPELSDMLSRFHHPWPAHFDCGAGWNFLLAMCSVRLRSIDPNYELYQVKEKFGALRIYASGVSSEAQNDIDDAVLHYSNVSLFFCEECGMTGRLRRTSTGTFMTRCDVHAYGAVTVPGSSYVSASPSNTVENGADLRFAYSFQQVMQDVSVSYMNILLSRMDGIPG